MLCLGVHMVIYRHVAANGHYLLCGQAASARLRAARLLLGEFLSACVAQEQRFHPEGKADRGEQVGGPWGQRSAESMEVEENLPWKRHGTVQP